MAPPKAHASSVGSSATLPKIAAPRRRSPPERDKNSEAEPARIPIGELARRSGVAASALRFYEEAGLLSSMRSDSGRRHYARSDLRRVAFIRAAQTVGLSLDAIRTALDQLPEGRTPNPADWERLSASWRPLLDRRIAELSRLRDTLSACIGCGCLSLNKCALYNPGDQASRGGAGARYWLGDTPPLAQEVESKPVPRSLNQKRRR